MWSGGKYSDWSKWLDLALKHPKLSKEDALVLYGEVVRYNISYRNDDLRPEEVDFYDFYGVDRKRFMEGLSACSRRYKGSSTWASAYFYHACMADDEGAIKEALAAMDFKFDPRVVGAEEFFNLLYKVEEVYPDALPKVKE